MNKIHIETSAGELLDKITILEIKKEKISDQKSLEIIDREYSSLKDSVIQWEDHQALFAKNNGLHIIENIVQKAPLFLSKLKLPVKSYNIWLGMNTKTKMLIYSIDKTKVKVDRAIGFKIIFCYRIIFNFIGVCFTKRTILVLPLTNI